MKNLKMIFDSLDMEFTDKKEKQFFEYMNLLLERNKYINLTAITDRDEFIKKHYIDSVLAAKTDELKNAKTIIDIGTGGGFPGIPLAIAFPDKKFVLIDSLNKRIKIINELAETIGIDNVTAVHGRAEELARKKDYRESFDVCVSRAVANMSTLSEYCIPFIKLRGYFIAYKGPDCEKEVAASAKAVKTLGGRIMRIDDCVFENIDFDHRLVIIEKEKSTVSKYPRKAGMPSKEPII